MNAAYTLRRVWRWLRAGHPADNPHGYLALVALLPRTLTDADIEHITDALIDQAIHTHQPITATHLTLMTRQTALHEATAHDTARITARLTTRGWTITTPPTDS